MDNRPRAPLFATINVTGRCNLTCKYCYFQPREHGDMTLENFRKVIGELADQEVFFVNLSGGEPFVHPEIDTFIRYAHDRFRHVVVLTNGTILRRCHVAMVTDIVRAKGEFPIQVSLDSISPEVNEKTRSDPSKILRNIRVLSEIGADIVIAMVITRFNFRSVVDSVVQLSQFTRYFHLMGVQPVKALNGADGNYGLTEDEFADLWNELRALRKTLDLSLETPGDECGQGEECAFGAPCNAGFSHLVIDPSLKVRPCDRCVHTCIGDLACNSIEEVWEGEAVRKVLGSPVPFCRRSDQMIMMEQA